MEIYDLGKEPISAEQPSGRDVTYDEEYEKLTGEIKKLSSPTADSAIDWSRVIQLSRKILAEDSKNMQVACYLSIALCHTEGLQGCITGIHVLRELLENFWDTMYPPKKRKKGRINTLLWWNEKIRDFLENIEPESLEGDKREEAISDLSVLDEFVGENLPDGPILRPLVERLSGILLDSQPQKVAFEPVVYEQGQKAEPESVPSTSVTEKVISSESKKIAVTAAVASVSASLPIDNNGADADEYFTSGKDYLAEAGERFFKKDYSHPISYQLNRILAWSRIDVLPANTGGKTMLPSPDEQVVALLKGQYESGQWSALLSSAEGHIHQYLFWLDLSFWVATALEKLQADSAAMAVANDTLLYTKRLNSLERLCFVDGMPFASDATREWLAGICRPAGDNIAVVASDATDRSGEFQTIAMQILKDKGLPEALHYYQEKSGSPQNGREQFVHDLSFCQLMQKGEHADLSRPFAERLLNKVDEMQLELWEPELAFTAMLTVYKTFKLAAHKDQKKQVEALRDRIILLAPEKALSLI